MVKVRFSLLILGLIQLLQCLLRTVFQPSNFQYCILVCRRLLSRASQNACYLARQQRLHLNKITYENQINIISKYIMQLINCGQNSYQLRQLVLLFDQLTSKQPVKKDTVSQFFLKSTSSTLIFCLNQSPFPVEKRTHSDGQ